MSLQWSLIAIFLYAQIVVVLFMILPIISPKKWQKLFKSRFIKTLSNQASFYFVLVIGILILFLLESIREIRKYSSSEHKDHLDAELQDNMRLFRAQRNFYICSFSLFLCLVIRRLTIMISAQAILIAQNEAFLRQAESATTIAKRLLSQQKTVGENAQNDSNEAHDEEILEWKNQIKELQTKNQELELVLKKERKDIEALKSQALSLSQEYDRLSDEHSKCLQSGDKKSD